MYALAPWRESTWPKGEYWGIGSFYADGNKDQKVYCELMHSTDHGANWTRLAPHTPFIPLGAAGEFDDHTCYPARPLLDPRDPSRTLLFYSGGNGPHSGARSDFIALASVDAHAFVGLETTAPTQSLVTAPLPRMKKAAPTALALRLATKTGASVHVVVLSADGEDEICAAEPVLHVDEAITPRELQLLGDCALELQGAVVRLNVTVEGEATLYALHVE